MLDQSLVSQVSDGSENDIVQVAADSGSTVYPSQLVIQLIFNSVPGSTESGDSPEKGPMDPSVFTIPVDISEEQGRSISRQLEHFGAVVLSVQQGERQSNRRIFTVIH